MQKQRKLYKEERGCARRKGVLKEVKEFRRT
jgi:hypothetical protein